MKNGRPINLLPLLMGMNHPLGQNPWKYKQRYCAPKQKPWGWCFDGVSNLKELSELISESMLRRLKETCIPELPEKTRIFHPAILEDEKSYKDQIKECVAEYEARVKEGKVSADATAIVTMNILRRIGSIHKCASAIQMAEELLEQGKQVIIFTEFLESAHLLNERLSGEILTGETSPSERQNIVDRFQSGQSKVLVGTIKAGGVGLTLTAASDVILVDRAWTPGDCYQAEDRAHRIGQNSAVFCHWIQLGRIDQEIDSLIESKDGNIQIVLKGGKKTQTVRNASELARVLIPLL
jgi:SNF2 family DNA or RNA helicase